MLQAGKRLRKSTGVMAGTGDRRKSSTLPILLPASRCRRMCCVIAGVSLARRPAAAAFDAFGGLVFCEWRGLGGAGFRAVGCGIGEGANVGGRGTTREMSKIKF
jgi:hypothetical protein